LYPANLLSLGKTTPALPRPSILRNLIGKWEISMAAKVVARKSGLHGMGLFAARDLAAEERLIEYKGIRYGKDEYPDMDGDGVTKFLGLSDGTGIDGKGWAALANHGCDPNCELVEEDGHDLPRAWLYTLREIKKGEELVWDYRLDITSHAEAFSDWACACGSPQCRGTMANPEQLRASEGHSGQ
jgi:SET domain-containing protein